jgi:hypothetical protein
LDTTNVGRCSVKRTIYEPRARVNVKPAVQVTLIILTVALLPKPVEMLARSDALGPIIGWTILTALAALAIFAWPVKR